MAAAVSTGGVIEDVHRPLNLERVARGWHGNNRECSYWIPEADVEGTVPPELYGTFFRNGPGLLEVYGKKLIHRKYDLKTCFYAPGGGGSPYYH